MHDISDLQGVYPVIKLPYPEHVPPDVLAFFTFAQMLDLCEI